MSDKMIFHKPIQGALFMFDKGCKVFPLISNGKVPAFKGWQEWAETASRKKIEDFGTANPLSNWGIYCGASNLIVIDVDNKNGKNGSETLKQLEAENELLPKTFTVRTPSGGYHYYFKGQCKSGTNVVGAGIDIKSEGGYVVAPGSRIDELSYEYE